MPTYAYLCTVSNEEFEEYHSISHVLEECPLCKKAGLPNHAPKRLICGTSRGVVELTGQDLVDKIKADAKQLQRDASKNEKIYSNLIGDARYESIQTKMDKRNR